MLTLNLPESPTVIKAGPNEILVLTNADLRESANVTCWPTQVKYEKLLEQALTSRFGLRVRRAHPIKTDKGHGFISSQREGSDVVASLDPSGLNATVVLVLVKFIPGSSKRSLPEAISET